MNQCSNTIIVPRHSPQKCGLGSFFHITDKLRRLASNGFRHFIVNLSDCLHVEFAILKALDHGYVLARLSLFRINLSG